MWFADGTKRKCILFSILGHKGLKEMKKSSLNSRKKNLNAWISDEPTMQSYSAVDVRDQDD